MRRALAIALFLLLTIVACDQLNKPMATPSGFGPGFPGGTSGSSSGAPPGAAVGPADGGGNDALPPPPSGTAPAVSAQPGDVQL